jgi:hypothetical protein
MYPIDASASTDIATIAFPALDGARESVTLPIKINIMSGIMTLRCTW